MDVVTIEYFRLGESWFWRVRGLGGRVVVNGAESYSSKRRVLREIHTFIHNMESGSGARIVQVTV